MEQRRAEVRSRAEVLETAEADLGEIEESLSALEAQAELGFAELTAVLTPHVEAIRQRVDTARRHVSLLGSASEADWASTAADATRALQTARSSLDEVLSRFRTRVAGSAAGRRVPVR